MTGLDFDETDEHRFQYATEGYGAEVSGGTPEERAAVFSERFEGDVVEVDCQECEDGNDVMERIVVKTGYREPDELERFPPDSIDVRRGLADADAIVFLEFDSMPYDGQQSTAQLMKGVAETSEFDGQIGYTVEEGGAVVDAEFDLASRIRTWNLDD